MCSSPLGGGGSVNACKWVGGQHYVNVTCGQDVGEMWFVARGRKTDLLAIVLPDRCCQPGRRKHLGLGRAGKCLSRGKAEPTSAVFYLMHNACTTLCSLRPHYDSVLSTSTVVSRTRGTLLDCMLAIAV